MSTGEVVVSARRRARLALISILAAAFFLRVVVARLLPNMIWPDEIFQTLEQAHRVVFGTGVIPWEFRAGTRSWMLPGLLAIVMKGSTVFGSSVGVYLTACQATLSAISLAPVWAGFRTAFDRFGLRAAIVAAGMSAVWFELVYFAPKAMNEVVAAHCLVAGVVLGELAARAGATARRRQVIAFAALLALASMLRIQLSIAAFVCFAIVFFKLDRRSRWLAVGSATAVVLAAGFLDALTWSYPFQSYVENIRVNILQHKSEHYGTAPWYAYFRVYADIWGVPGTVVVLGLAGLGVKRAPMVAWCALAVLLAHVPIAHKEYRFAYPALVLVVLLAGLGAGWLVTKVEAQRGSRVATLAAVGLLAVWLAVSLNGAGRFHETRTRLADTFGPAQSHWVMRSGGLRAMEDLGDTPEICGIGFVGTGWGITGGYTYLNRDIPLFDLHDAAEMKKLAPFANALITGSDRPATIGPYTRVECWEDACEFVRPGGCAVLPGYDYNHVVELRGE